MEQFGLKGGSPSSTTFPETMEDVVEVNGGGEAEIDNDRHHFLHQLHQANTIVVSFHLCDEHHRLPSGFLLNLALSEFRLHQHHHPLPMGKGQWPCPCHLHIRIHLRFRLLYCINIRFRSQP